MSSLDTVIYVSVSASERDANFFAFVRPFCALAFQPHSRTQRNVDWLELLHALLKSCRLAGVRRHEEGVSVSSLEAGMLIWKKNYDAGKPCQLPGGPANCVPPWFPPAFWSDQHLGEQGNLPFWHLAVPQPPATRAKSYGRTAQSTFA